MCLCVFRGLFGRSRVPVDKKPPKIEPSTPLASRSALIGHLISINENLLSMIPYIVTLVVLVLFVKNSKSPAALGNPYKKGER